MSRPFVDSGPSRESRSSVPAFSQKKAILHERHDSQATFSGRPGHVLGEMRLGRSGPDSILNRVGPLARQVLTNESGEAEICPLSDTQRERSIAGHEAF